MSRDAMTGLQPKRREAGYFGKMPIRGDFLSHGLPRQFVDSWDDWIRLALDNSRNQLLDSWLDIYLTSPVWHFALAPTVCDDSSWAGVLMPSVDAVGRYFPLTITAPVDSDTNIIAILSMSQNWFEKLEGLARSCLEDGFDLPAFEKEIQVLGQPDGNPTHIDLDGGNVGDRRLLNAWRYGLDSPAQLTTDCLALLPELMERLFRTYSVWWTSGSTCVSPTLLICQGLPPPEGYAAMLDGEWGKWGWEDKQVFERVPIAESN